jgi:hypothetical protein
MSSTNLLRLIAAVMLALTFTTMALELPQAENPTALPVPQNASIRRAPWPQIISKGNSLALTERARKTEQSVSGEQTKLVLAVARSTPTRVEQSKAPVFVTVSRLDRMADHTPACTILGDDEARCARSQQPKLGPAVVGSTPTRVEQSKAPVFVTVSRLDRMADHTPACTILGDDEARCARSEQPKLGPAVAGSTPTRVEQSKAAIFVSVSRLDRMADHIPACTILGDDEARCAKEGISPLHQTPKREEAQKRILTGSVIHDTKVVEKKLPRQRERAKAVGKEIAKRAVNERASVRKHNIRAKGKKGASPLIAAVEKIKLKNREIRKNLPLQLAKARTVLLKKLALGRAQKNNRIW